MKKTRLTVLSLIVIFLLFSLGNLFAQNNEDSKFQKLLEKRCLLFSLTIRDNPIPMIFVWKRKERQVT